MNKIIRADIRRDEFQKNDIELNKSAAFYNPYTLSLPSGKGYVLNRLIFFDPNAQEVVVKTQSSWFGDSNEIGQLHFWTDKPLARKTKLNLSAKCPFYIKSKRSWDISYDLYIPTTDLPYIKYRYFKVPKVGIMRNADIGQPNPEHNYLHELVRRLDGALCARFAFEDKLQGIKTAYDVIEYSDEQWERIIQELKELRREYFVAKNAEEDYTTEDYLKEISKETE